MSDEEGEVFFNNSEVEAVGSALSTLLHNNEKSGIWVLREGDGSWESPNIATFMFNSDEEGLIELYIESTTLR